MHVEGNRRAFRHVHIFKIVVDELYSVRMYEDQTLRKWRNFRKQKIVIKIP